MSRPIDRLTLRLTVIGREKGKEEEDSSCDLSEEYRVIFLVKEVRGKINVRCKRKSREGEDDLNLGCSRKRTDWSTMLM